MKKKGRCGLLLNSESLSAVPDRPSLISQLHLQRTLEDTDSQARSLLGKPRRFAGCRSAPEGHGPSPGDMLPRSDSYVLRPSSGLSLRPADKTLPCLEQLPGRPE